jgi:hypothetical protein
MSVIDRLFLGEFFVYASHLFIRLFMGTVNESNIKLLFARESSLFKNLSGTHIGNAAAGDDAFLYGRAGCIEGILDPVLLLLHFSLRYCAHIYNGHTPDQFRQAFLELFPVIVAGRLLDLNCLW